MAVTQLAAFCRAPCFPLDPAASYEPAAGLAEMMGLCSEAKVITVNRRDAWPRLRSQSMLWDSDKNREHTGVPVGTDRDPGMNGIRGAKSMV